MEDKTKTFIKKSNQRIEYWKSLLVKPVNNLKTIHERLKQINLNDMKEVEVINPYQAFFSWLLDVVASGTIVAIIYVLTFELSISTIFKWVVVFGLLRWFILDMTREIRKSIKNER